MRLLILSASTGGGHDMRAFALQDWCNEKGWTTEVFHPLESTFVGYRFGCYLYNLIQKKIPLLHYAYFHFLEFASIHRSSSKIIGAEKYIQKIESFLPDVIISMHAHLNHGYFELSKSLPKKPRFAVFCGELADGEGFSRHWVNPSNDLFISSFREGCVAAHKRGMPTSKTLASGPLLRKPFYWNSQRFEKITITEKLGLDPNLPIYLLGTGANGVNRHVQVINSIKEADLNCQVLALCGKNKKTFSKILDLSNQVSIKVIPFGEMDAISMVELLNISDWILARPGAGLTTEAIVTGCPVIFDLSGGCMPQEKNNLNFWLSRAGKSICSSSPKELIKIIQSGVEVPRLKIPVQSSPDMLLDRLAELASR